MRGYLLLLLAAGLLPNCAAGQAPKFHVLVFYSTSAEYDHVQFANDAVKFLENTGRGKNFAVDTTTNWDDCSEAKLRNYQLVVWLNESPAKEEHRQAFQKYMEGGGAWLGFHGAGYNDQDTHWPWYVDFLGGAVFHINSWPPLPAKLVVDERNHPVTAKIPESYVAPLNEWYVWKPSPRLNPGVRVLLTLDPANYPLGLKDVLLSGDCPVAWTNTKYKMIYMNMGHGSRIFSSAAQNQLIENAVLWLGGGAAPAQEQQAEGMRISAQAVLANAKTNRVYAVSTGENAVIVVNGENRKATRVAVGKEPSTIAINSATNRVYVGNAGDGTVSVLDGATDQVIATVKVGELPYVVAANSADNVVYVARTFSNTTTVINGATNQTSMLDLNIQATAIGVAPELNQIYLIDQGDELTILEGRTNTARKIRAGDHLWGLGVNAATNRVYLGSTNGPIVTVFDGQNASISSVKVGEMPCAMAVDSSANRVYVANYADSSVTVVDGSNNAVLGTISVGIHPQAVAVSPASHKICVANTGNSSVSIIDAQSNSVSATVKLSSGPYAIALDAAGKTAYVKCFGDDGVISIDLETQATSRIAGRTEAK